MSVNIPREISPLLTPARCAQQRALADEFATPGSVKHFALRLGFMPNDEADAEAIIDRCLRERDWLEHQIEIANLFASES